MEVSESRHHDLPCYLALYWFPGLTVALLEPACPALPSVWPTGPDSASQGHLLFLYSTASEVFTDCRIKFKFLSLASKLYDLILIYISRCIPYCASTCILNAKHHQTQNFLWDFLPTSLITSDFLPRTLTHVPFAIAYNFNFSKTIFYRRAENCIMDDVSIFHLWGLPTFCFFYFLPTHFLSFSYILKQISYLFSCYS